MRTKYKVLTLLQLICNHDTWLTSSHAGRRKQLSQFGVQGIKERLA